MPLLTLSPDQWLRIGLQLVGFDVDRRNVCRRTKMERFIAHFGARPETVNAMYVDMQTTNIPEAFVQKPNVCYFLMALNWLKSYSTETVMAGRFKKDEKTVRKYIWKYSRHVSALIDLKVRTHQC